MPKSDEDKFLLPPSVVTWIILVLLIISLWPDSPLQFNQLSLYLVVLLFTAAIFPHMRRISLRVPGGSIDWEKEVEEVARMLNTSLTETKEIGQGTDLQNLLFERWCRGFIARWILFLHHYLHEGGELDPEKAQILCKLVEEVSKDIYSQT